MNQLTPKSSNHKRGRPTKRRPLKLDEADKKILLEISKSKTAQIRKVERARILLMYNEGMSIGDIINLIKSRAKVEKSIDKALAFGPLTALDDFKRKGRPQIITPEAKTWVVSIACQKPKDLGYSHELWTISLLAKHICQYAESAGHPCLHKTSKSAVFRFLNEVDIKPHKIRYYLESRDPDFDRKMAEVLLVYQEVREEQGLDSSSSKAIISYDEKPGIQAIAPTAPDLSPIPNKHSTIARDYEYRRLGTLSLLAGIDLLDGHMHVQIEERHRSYEFIEFLKKLDQYYGKSIKIKIILDNHSAHKSKETMLFLQTMPERFEFVFTPTHGSWLNIIEMMFSKMARSMLRAIRVESLQELKNRILSYFHEINQDPEPPVWRYGLS